MAVAVREVERHAKLAGLREGASLDAVERRRLQLWAVMSACLVALSLLIALSSLSPTTSSLTVVPPKVLQFGMVALSLGFSVYVFEKERALRRLTGLLVDEQVKRFTLSREIGRLQELVQAGRAMTESLELERVVDLVLDHALNLFGAPTGSVLLMGPDGRLAVQAVRGETNGGPRIDRGESVARRVALTREATLISADDAGSRRPGQTDATQRGMSVPLMANRRLVGVLNIHAAADDDFGDLDLSILEAFGEHAGVAIANAARFEEERANSNRYAQLEQVRQEFRWLAR